MMQCRVNDKNNIIANYYVKIFHFFVTSAILFSIFFLLFFFYQLSEMTYFSSKNKSVDESCWLVESNESDWSRKRLANQFWLVSGWVSKYDWLIKDKIILQNTNNRYLLLTPCLSFSLSFFLFNSKIIDYL